ncbi:MAG: BMP family ABC transporter substrate-binding protein [Enterocloster clostridioformis]
MIWVGASQPHDGLKLLEADYGCEVTYTENLTPDDIEAAFADYAASGYDVVIGHGYEFGDPAVDVAEQYPDTKFIVTEGEVSADNVASYVSKCAGRRIHHGNAGSRHVRERQGGLYRTDSGRVPCEDYERI